jgi:Mn2+/Fe2+ NRAMP family transporter
MKNSLLNEWRYAFLAWLGCILLPLPALVLWRSDEGRSDALILFSVGCVNLVAYTFQRDIHRQNSDVTEHPERIWRKRMASAGISLFFACVIFSLLSLALNDSHDFVEVLLAFLIPIPALCVMPFFMLITRKQVAAVVFTVFTVFCMKLLGCIVVVLVYGWDASSHNPPYTDMPWTHPNLLVWLFWLNTGVLSLWLYVLGKRKYMRNMTAPPNKSPETISFQTKSLS